MSTVAELQPKERPGEELAEKLVNVADAVPFPLEAMGELLGNAARAIADSVKAPPAIAAHSVLAAAAFAAQDKANLVMDGRTIPLSLFLLTVAESGDRKSACDKVASAPLANWQREKVLDHMEELRTYRKAQAVYDSEHKAALAGSKKTAREKAAALDELECPEPPPEPIVICQEPTLEGLQKSFRQGCPSQALFTDEGAQFFGGHAMNAENCQKTIAGLSKYWDGSPIVRTRAAQGESVTMYDRRLSIHLLVQPIIAEKVLADPLLMQQGILARFLVAEAPTLAGTRLYSEVNAYKRPKVMDFHARLSHLLAYESATDESGGLELPTLSLSDDARAVWVESYDLTESKLGAGRLLEAIKPIASKAAENANRIAGIFAILEGTAEVTGDQMTRAWVLVSYYLQGALRASQMNAATALERDAREVLEWLRGRENGQQRIDTMQRLITPARHRKSCGHIRAVMAALVAAGMASIAEHNGKGEPCAWEVVK